MRVTIATLLVFLGLTTAQASGDIFDADTLKLQNLDPKFAKAIEKWNPKFKTYQLNDYPKLVRDLFTQRRTELPMAVRADFNGDGLVDLALMGHDQKNTYVLFVAKFPKGEKVVQVIKLDNMDPTKLKATNGEVTEPGLPLYIGLAEGEEIGRSDVKKSADSLFVETFGGKNDLYQLDVDRLHKIPDAPKPGS